MRKGFLGGLIALAIVGAAAPAAHGALSWDVPSYTFPDTDQGISSPPRTFTLTATCNAGAALCMDPAGGVHAFGDVSAPGADFNLDSTSCAGSLVTATFPSSASCTATVAFKPSGTGAKTGVLTTASGVQVLLNGTGVDSEASGGEGAGKKCKKRKKKGKSSASSAKKKKRCKKKKRK